MRRHVDPALQGAQFAARTGSGYRTQRDLAERSVQGARYETETGRIVPARRSETLGPWMRAAVSGTGEQLLYLPIVTGTNTCELVTTPRLMPMGRAGRIVGARLLADATITAGTVVVRARVQDASAVVTATDLADCTLDTTTSIADVQLPYELGVPFEQGSSVGPRAVLTSISPAVALACWLVVEFEEPVT